MSTDLLGSTFLDIDSNNGWAHLKNRLQLDGKVTYHLAVHEVCKEVG